MLRLANLHIMHASIAAYVALADQCNHSVSILMQAEPQLPGTLESLHVHQRRDVLLEVRVNARGDVTLVKMMQSSHNRDLDTRAERAARDSRYSPAMVDCKPEPGETLFRVTYDPAQE